MTRTQKQIEKADRHLRLAVQFARGSARLRVINAIVEAEKILDDAHTWAGKNQTRARKT